MHPSRGSRVFYFTVRKLKLDYLPAGNSIDICPTFERKRQGQTFNYCSFSEGFAAKAASGVSSPCVNISAFSPVTQLVICLLRVLIHEARSLQKTQHEAPTGPPGPAQGSSTSTRPGGTELCGVAAGRELRGSGAPVRTPGVCGGFGKCSPDSKQGSGTAGASVCLFLLAPPSQAAWCAPGSPED